MEATYFSFLFVIPVHVLSEPIAAEVPKQTQAVVQAALPLVPYNTIDAMMLTVTGR